MILLRVSGSRIDDTLRWLPTRSVLYWGGQPLKNGQPAKGLAYYETTFQTNRSDSDVPVKVAAGAWLTVASNDGAGSVSFFRKDHKFDFGKARSHAAHGRSGTAVAVAHNITGGDIRLVAVNRDGKTHAGVHSIAPSGEGNRLLDAEFDLPPYQIKEYQVQSRPFEEAVISGVALRRREGLSPPQRTRSQRQEPSPAADTQPFVRELHGAEIDSDGDGLSDFQEIHKYRTRPQQVQHGGRWRRRRRLAAAPRVHIHDPVDRQGDAAGESELREATTTRTPRIRSRNDRTSSSSRSIHYPLNTNAEAIRGNPDWRRDAAVHDRIPGAPASRPTGTPSMQRDLIARSQGRRHRPRSARRQGSRHPRLPAWLLAKSKFVNMFCTHYMHYPEGPRDDLSGARGQV